VYNDRTGKEFNVTGVEAAVFCTFIPVADFPMHFNNTFRFKPGEEVGKDLVFRVKYHLRFALTVAEIEKKYPPVVA
jgi:hypothetical protein